MKSHMNLLNSVVPAGALGNLLRMMVEAGAPPMPGTIQRKAPHAYQPTPPRPHFDRRAAQRPKKLFRGHRP